MQEVVPKNKRLEELGVFVGGPMLGTKQSIGKQFNSNSDIDTVKEIMGDKFHY